MRLKHLLVMALAWAGNKGHAQVVAVSGYSGAGAYRQTPQHALLAGAHVGLLPLYKTFTATVYTEKRFNLNELSLINAGIIVPVSNGSYGLQLSSFGGSAYSQRKAALGYGRSLGSRMHVGLQFNYMHLHMAGYGNVGSVSADAGLVYQISDKLVAGLQLSHLAGTASNYLKGERQPRTAAAGIGYAPSDEFYISTSIVKEAGQPLGIEAALQYQVLQKLQVTGGLHSGNSNLYVGAGFQLLQMQLHAVASFHPQLGISPGIMLTFKKDRD